MIGVFKLRRHKWHFVSAFKAPYKVTKVFTCKVCKVSKFVYLDSLTHSHLKTEYVNESGTFTKAPACTVRELSLF